MNSCLSRRRFKEEFDFGDADEGDGGIPVTYTRDIVADLLHEETDRHHADLDVGSVIMPRDVLNAMAEGLEEAPVFSGNERTEYENRLVPVKNHIFGRQEDDVVDAIMRDKRVDGGLVDPLVPHDGVDDVVLLAAEDVVLHRDEPVLVLGPLVAREDRRLVQPLGHRVQQVPRHDDRPDVQVGVVAVGLLVEQVRDDVAGVRHGDAAVALLGVAEVELLLEAAFVAVLEVAAVVHQRLVDQVQPRR